jgi:hypothetical protein
MIDYLLNIEIPLWVPMLLALLCAISLYQLGRAEERRRQSNSLCQRIRRHKARSILIPMR